MRPLLPLLVCTLVASAAETEPTKLAVADAYPLDPGTIQVDVGLSAARATRAFDADGRAAKRGSTASTHTLDLGLDYGLLPSLEIGTHIALVRTAESDGDPDSGRGLSDWDVGAKWQAWSHEDGDLAVAVGALPTVAIPLGRGQDADSQLPTASRAWSAGGVACVCGNWDRLSFNADAGYVAFLGTADERDGSRGQWVADAAVGWLVCEHFQPEVDVSYGRDRPEEGQAAWATTVTIGAQFPFDGGRLMAGLSKVVDGVLVDQEVSANVMLQYEL